MKVTAAQLRDWGLKAAKKGRCARCESDDLAFEGVSLLPSWLATEDGGVRSAVTVAAPMTCDCGMVTWVSVEYLDVPDPDRALGGS